MWLLNSTIGRKFIMALTGLCLVLFVTFHVAMNAVALIWPTAYNAVCEFLGANWYALIASVGLAALFILHIVYALWLTIQNRAARGNDRYLVTARPPQVEWASKNMLVLGLVVLAFLVVHLIQFWAKMQWQELRHAELSVLPVLNGAPVPPAQGTLFIEMAFKEIWTPIVYIIGFVALWFHMNHGFWSMFQSAGYNGRKWLPRLKKIGMYWSTLVVGLFIAQAIVFTVQAHRGYYTKNIELQEQYAEYWNDYSTQLTEEYVDGLNAALQPYYNEMEQLQGMDFVKYYQIQGKIDSARTEYMQTQAPAFIEKAALVEKAFKTHCPDLAPSREMQEMILGAKELQQRLSASATPGQLPQDAAETNLPADANAANIY